MSVPERVVAVRSLQRVAIARQAGPVVSVSAPVRSVTSVEPAHRVVVARAGRQIVAVRSPAGPPGPEGPAGAPGGFFAQSYAVAALTWMATHNLGYEPAATLYDTSGRAIVGHVIENTPVLTRVEFAVPVAGRMTLS